MTDNLQAQLDTAIERAERLEQLIKDILDELGKWNYIDGTDIERAEIINPLYKRAEQLGVDWYKRV